MRLSNREESIRYSIEDSPYINKDAGLILNEVSPNQIAYGYEWQGDYVFFWFVKALW